MSLPLLIIGAGGHAAVVADALLTCGERVLGFTDADVGRWGTRLCGLPILGDDQILQTHLPHEVLLANGIGGVRGGGPRQRVQQGLEARGWHFASVRHPTAIVSARASIGVGAQMLAGCVVQVGAHIGKGCIVNTATVIEHDCKLGDYVHTAPGAIICGDVTIGARSHVGAGAVVCQGLGLGEDTVVGAGAVVVRNFAGGGLLVGVPARPVEAKV